MTPSAPPATEDLQVDPPKGVLSKASRRVWERLAPAALTLKTLTPQTSHGFALLCQCVVYRDEIELAMTRDGWTYENQFGEPKRHPLWGVWQVTTLRVEQQLARFGLMADGKPQGAPASSQPTAAENPWAVIAKR